MAITRLSIDGYGARRAGSFAGRVEVVAVPPVVVDQSLGGKPEKRKTRRKSLYDDIERVALPEVSIQDVKAQEVNEPLSVTATEAQSPEFGSLTTMADAFSKAGIRTPEQIISEQETIDQRKRFNLAAIILLLD